MITTIFKALLLKFYKHHFECSVVTLIIFLRYVYFRCILKIKKAKFEIQKELDDPIANGKRNVNTDIQRMTENRTANEEDAAKVIQKFEEIITNSGIVA